MIITIAAPAGGNKTRTALEIGSFLGLNNNQKVIYITNDNDYMDWVPHIESIVGKDKMNAFRPVYSKTLEGAIHILPYIDHLPYDIVILDGFSNELIKFPAKEFAALMHNIELYTTNKSGKIIVTIQGNNLDY